MKLDATKQELNKMNSNLRAREDDEVKILEGLKATIVALHDDEVIVETEDGRPKWIKVAHLEPLSSSGDASKTKNVWREVAKNVA
jgi:preprotein translocase subunit YajC